MRAITKATTKARLELRRFMSPYPSVFLPMMRRRAAHDGHVIGEKTEIVIEGFPRSGNTFAVAAFEFAQQRPVEIARHLHAAAHVIEGVRRGLPVVVVCREPGAAAISTVIRHPEMTLRMALRQYCSFHQPLLEYLGTFVIAPFDITIGDFGTVIDEVNERYGTAYLRFAHTPENVAKVFERVDAMDLGDATRRSDDPSHTVGRPVAERESQKRQLASLLADPSLEKLLNEARRLHSRFTPPR